MGREGAVLMLYTPWHIKIATGHPPPPPPTLQHNIHIITASVKHGQGANYTCIHNR
jgi:hypothetical protein